ncbi:MAG: ATP-binding protein [Candidatus Thermoplasmatota archaeon]
MDVHTYRVLLVEDTDWDARIAREALEAAVRSKFVVVRVASLSDAHAALAGGRFDAIIADLNLPDSTGVATVSALRAATGERIAIIVMTGSLTDTSGVDALAHGCDEYVSKETIAKAGGEILPSAVRFAIEHRAATARISAILKQHETTLQTVPDAVVRLDEEGRFVWMNHAAETVFGKASAALVGTSAIETIVPADRGLMKTSIDQARAYRRAEQWPIHIPARDGTLHTYAWTCAPTTDPDGRGISVIGVARDVTQEQLAVERERTLSITWAENDRLKALTDERARILSAVAHEINNPLCVLIMQVAILKEHMIGDLNKDQDKAIMVLDRTIERIRGIMADMLDMARIHSGNLRAHKERVDLRQLANETAEAYAPLVANAGLTLDVHATEEVLVEADQRRVAQVLVNFVTNAIKFTPSGGKVTIEAAKDATGPILRVRDTGRGLTAEQIGGLFEPFSQMHQDSAQKGSGLGLYISRGIVEDHGGTIGCVSGGPDRGSTFWARLPAAPK